MNVHSESSVVIKYAEGEILIRKNELRIFLALKKMTLSVQFEYTSFSVHDLNNHGVKESDETEVVQEDYQWIINYQRTPAFGRDGYQSNARLLGKKMLYGYKNYKEPDEHEIATGNREYVSFIIGVNENGTARQITSNLDKLSGSEIKQYAYHPVTFKNAVLERYYTNPEIFTIEDSVVWKKGSWRLPIDNNAEDYISAYLVDLS